MARIVIAAVGSLGDLHPSMAVARALAERGHSPVIATHPGYRARVAAAGLEFAPVRPDFEDNGDLKEVLKRAMHETRGSMYVVRELVLPHVRASYTDMLTATEDADAIVTHMLSFAGVLVAEQHGLPRITPILQPMVLLSAYDPPVMPTAPDATWMRHMGPGVWKLLWQLARATSRGWFGEVDALRKEIGLPASKAHPMFDGFSPLLNLALFPSVLAQPQPDWPANTIVTGLCRYDRDEAGAGMPVVLREFLDAGSPPIVFTLGSSGVYNPEGFYRAAAEAAAAVGRRSVLLVGPQPEAFATALPADCLVIDYAPHSDLMPRAAAIVHHGGAGTTGHALAAGRPMVIVPFSHDQPDNAARCERLGVARVVRRKQLSAATLSAALREVLEDPRMATRAAEIGAIVSAEDGARTAAAAIERVLAAKR